MLHWRKKNDGFEWHKYVKTAIKVRREKRQQRFEDAKVAAVAGLKDAGRASVAAGAQGSAVAGALAVRGAMSLWAFLKQAAVLFAQLPGFVGGIVAAALVRFITGVLLPTWHWLAVSLEPWARQVMRPGAELVLWGIGLLATASAALRTLNIAFDREAMLAAAIGAAALFAAALPILTGMRRVPVPWPVQVAGAAVARALRAVPAVPRAVAGLAVLCAMAVGGWLAWSPGSMPLARLPGLGAEVVEGRASVASGDVLSINGRLIRLAGIEAPDRDQKCQRPGNPRWRCGQSAESALARLVRRDAVRCELRGADEAGRRIGTCIVNGQDVSGSLVREGHVFSAGGLFAGYASLEKEARAQKAGLWRGEAERPSDYRAKLWNEAKRAAPDGCPIKGQVASGTKVYVLPWSPDYSKVRVRTTRGERWFCSEQDAQAAGWKQAARG
jgi:endonuclease YncB( thermonuclease family)